MSNIVSATLFQQDAQTPVQSLAAASNIQWLDELADTGSFSFRIPVEYLPNIEIGWIVKFGIGPTSADYVWAGIVETIKINQIGSGNDGINREYEISGRGVRAILEDAIVYNVGGQSSRTFTSVTAGEIMKTFIDEAQLRLALDYLQYDFDNTDDSNGDPFTETISISESVGTSLLAVTSKLQELAIDAWVDPDLVLHYVNYRGVDKSNGGYIYGGNGVVFRVGHNVGELSQQITGPIKNNVLVASGTAGTMFGETINAASQAIYGRKEIYLPITSTEDGTVISLAAQNLLDATANPADGTTIQVADNGPLPYIDFEVGDTVGLVKLDGTKESYRVRSISISVDESGNFFFVPELGSARPDLTKRLNAILNRLERVNAGGESDFSTSGGLSGFGGGEGGGLEFENGEVLTYDALTETGTVDIDGTTFNFNNATGFGLGIGDIITLADILGVTDKTAISVFDRAGSYTPLVINNPQAVAGFPFDGDQLPDPFNYAFSDAGNIGTPLTPSNYPACAIAHFGNAILGYAGRVVVFIERVGGTEAQPTIVFYDAETGSSTAVNRTAAVGATNRTTNIGVIGTRLFVSYDGTTGNCVESYNSSTGVWSTHDIQSAVFLGVSDSRAWWVGKVSGAPNNTRWKVVSIDSSGTLSSIDNPGNVTTGTQVFGRAKNGQLFFRLNVAGALLYTADTNVAAASLTFTSATAPATLPYSSTGAAGAVAIRDGNRAYAYSDIDSNGDCYYYVRTGTPATAGFAVIDATTLAVTTYTQLTSATGAAADGELLLAGGLCLAGTTVVLFGAVREDLVTGGTRTGSCVPAYWRTDGATTTRTDDTEYIGLLGSTGGSTEGFARTTVVHRDDVTNTFYFHTNLAANGGLGAAPSGSKVAGPSYGEAFTV